MKNNLKAIRIERGMAQVQVAKALGLQHRTGLAGGRLVLSTLVFRIY
jgi:hypothetical protein